MTEVYDNPFGRPKFSKNMFESREAYLFPGDLTQHFLNAAKKNNFQTRNKKPNLNSPF